LNKAGFDSQISFFFSDYLINRQTQYVWNSFVSTFFTVNVGIEQGSSLFLILSTIYIASIFHIFEKITKSLYILFQLLLFYLQIINFSFLKKKFMKNQMQTSFVVITLSYPFSIPSALLLNITS